MVAQLRLQLWRLQLWWGPAVVVWTARRSFAALRGAWRGRELRVETSPLKWRALRGGLCLSGRWRRVGFGFRSSVVEEGNRRLDAAMRARIVRGEGVR